MVDCFIDRLTAASSFGENRFVFREKSRHFLFSGFFVGKVSDVRIVLQDIIVEWCSKIENILSDNSMEETQTVFQAPLSRRNKWWFSFRRVRPIMFPVRGRKGLIRHSSNFSRLEEVECVFGGWNAASTFWRKSNERNPIGWSGRNRVGVCGRIFGKCFWWPFAPIRLRLRGMRRSFASWNCF